ncbi:MAG: amidohydrolase family protein [Flavobacteriales bacterium]|nr:amidohydrolase family protein [Flavobacteriales bacterium]
MIPKVKKYTFLKSVILITLYTCVAESVLSQLTPAPKQNGHTLIKNATAHLGNGHIIENSVIAFEDGKITLIGDARVVRLDMSTYNRVIDGTGKHVYPGFIATNSTLGLVEIGAVRASNDQSETGTLNPNVRSVIAYNTDSKIIPTVRSNGVLMAQITPKGGIISGISSVVQLDAWNWEDAIVKEDDGIHINWPSMYSTSGWWAEPGETKKEDSYTAKKEEIIKFFNDAKAYCSISFHLEKNLRFESMRGVFNGTKNIYIHANYVKELADIVYFKRDFDFSKLTIVGAYDSWMISEMLKENNVSVMLKRLHELPERSEEDTDLPFKIPYLLHKAGVLFCLQNSGDMEQMHTRNLPFLAGTASTYGIPKEEALMLITLNAAKILGIDKQCGSLELGKEATLFISSGDALDMLTNNVEHAFIQGREIDLNNHQKELYEKYKKKYAE